MIDVWEEIGDVLVDSAALALDRASPALRGDDQPFFRGALGSLIDRVQLGRVENVNQFLAGLLQAAIEAGPKHDVSDVAGVQVGDDVLSELLGELVEGEIRADQQHFNALALRELARAVDEQRLQGGALPVACRRVDAARLHVAIEVDGERRAQ